jgi:hypothetical protein
MLVLLPSCNSIHNVEMLIVIIECGWSKLSTMLMWMLQSLWSLGAAVEGEGVVSQLQQSHRIVHCDHGLEMMPLLIRCVLLASPQLPGR